MITTDPIRQAFRPPGRMEEPSPPDGGPPLDPDAAIPIPGEMSFDEFLAGLNPLHHLPGVGMIYRAATGAEIHPVMRIAGAGLLGGPVGIVTAAALSLIELSRPVERMRAHYAGRPDPFTDPGGTATAAAAPAPRDVAEAYRRWGQLARG